MRRIVAWFAAGTELRDHTRTIWTGRPYHLGRPTPGEVWWFGITQMINAAWVQARATVMPAIDLLAEIFDDGTDQ